MMSQWFMKGSPTVCCHIYLRRWYKHFNKLTCIYCQNRCVMRKKNYPLLDSCGIKSWRTSEPKSSVGHDLMVEHPWKSLSSVALINHSITTSVWLQPRRDVLGMQCLSTSPGARRGGGELAEGDGRRQVDSCVDRLETQNAVQSSAGGIYAPTAAGPGSRIYLGA